MNITERISGLLSQIECMSAANAEELEALRIKYLSKKGEIASLFSEFRNVPNEQKKELGAQLNALKDKATERMNALREQFEQATQLQDKPDLTRTPDPIALGTRHPLSLVREEIIDIFSRIGFVVADGPEVEDDRHVFGTRTSRTRHAGHVLHREGTRRTKAYRHPTTHTYIQRSDARHDPAETAYPRALPRTRISQRGYQRTRTLLLPPDRRFVHRQERQFCRPARGAAVFGKGIVRTRNEDSSAPVVLPLYRTQRRDGYLV